MEGSSAESSASPSAAESQPSTEDNTSTTTTATSPPATVSNVAPSAASPAAPPVPAQIREDEVGNAVRFLTHPRVKGAPEAQRRAFLEKKGLNASEIEEAFRRAKAQGDSETTPPAASSPYPPPAPPASVPSTSQQALGQAGGQPYGAVQSQLQPSQSKAEVAQRMSWSQIVLLAGAATGAVLFVQGFVSPWVTRWWRGGTGGEGKKVPVVDEEDEETKRRRWEEEWRKQKEEEEKKKAEEAERQRTLVAKLVAEEMERQRSLLEKTISEAATKAASIAADSASTTAAEKVEDFVKKFEGQKETADAALSGVIEKMAVTLSETQQKFKQLEEESKARSARDALGLTQNDRTDSRGNVNSLMQNFQQLHVSSPSNSASLPPMQSSAHSSFPSQHPYPSQSFHNQPPSPAHSTHSLEGAGVRGPSRGSHYLSPVSSSGALGVPGQQLAGHQISGHHGAVAIPSDPPHPKPYDEVLTMLQQGRIPPNVNPNVQDKPPNPEQPPPEPRMRPRPKPWEVHNSPAVPLSHSEVDSGVWNGGNVGGGVGGVGIGGEAAGGGRSGIGGGVGEGGLGGGEAGYAYGGGRPGMGSSQTASSMPYQQSPPFNTSSAAAALSAAPYGVTSVSSNGSLHGVHPGSLPPGGSSGGLGRKWTPPPPPALRVASGQLDGGAGGGEAPARNSFSGSLHQAGGSASGSFTGNGVDGMINPGGGGGGGGGVGDGNGGEVGSFKSGDATANGANGTGSDRYSVAGSVAAAE